MEIQGRAVSLDWFQSPTNRVQCSDRLQQEIIVFEGQMVSIPYKSGPVF